MRLHSRRSCCVCFWDGTRVGCCCCFCVRRTEEDFERKEIVLIQWNELVRADDAAAAAHRQTRSQVVQILVGIRPPSSSSACAAAYSCCLQTPIVVGYRALTLDSFVCVITLQRPLAKERSYCVDSRGLFRISRHHVSLN
jgi:hypothetical protein